MPANREVSLPESQTAVTRGHSRALAEVPSSGRIVTPNGLAKPIRGRLTAL
jgi:hypothetical protein